MKAGGKPKFKYKRVKIIWQDIITDASWFDSLEDVEKLTFQWCEDIGYLFSKDTKTVNAKELMDVLRSKDEADLQSNAWIFEGDTKFFDMKA